MRSFLREHRIHGSAHILDSCGSTLVFYNLAKLGKDLIDWQALLIGSLAKEDPALGGVNLQRITRLDAKLLPNIFRDDYLTFGRQSRFLTHASKISLTK